MPKYNITFLREAVTYQAEKGMSVLKAWIEAGLIPDAPCGGRGICGKCKVSVDGKVLLACQTLIERDMQIDTQIMQEMRTQILLSGCRKQVEFLPGNIPSHVSRPLLAAVDLGTTSVVAYLLDGKTGERLRIKSILNPQRQYGADVVMRSNYAQEHGAQILSSCIRRSIKALLEEMSREVGESPENIVRLVMVGNSCMHHLFLEISTKSLVLAPYEPKVKEALTLQASEFDLGLYSEAELIWLPNIGGFVGADTVACLLAAELEKQEEMTLLVDIGTNGEMVLGNHTGLTACSTAAGPAFEGAGITCGMRGNEGAIDRVWLENGEISFHVIGEGEPLGICGSGLLDAVACFLEMGLVDSTGRMKETFCFTDKVFINQKDIRELQLAKAAISAGIRLLCKKKGIAVPDVKRLLVAGAFGNYMNPDSACAVGLIPKELKGRITPIGNAAGEGAQIAVLNQEELRRSSILAEQTEFLELALDPDFQEVYVEEMEFPIQDV